MATVACDPNITSRYILGDLSSEEADRYERHLRLCAECQNCVTVGRRVKESFRTLSSTQAHQLKSDGVLSCSPFIRALLVVLVLVVIALIYSR